MSEENARKDKRFFKDIRDLYKDYYTQLTGGILTNMQYKVLAYMVPYPIVDSDSKMAICKDLGISLYNLNNLIKKLKDADLIVKNREGYTLKNTIPNGSSFQIVTDYDLKEQICRKYISGQEI